MLRMKIGLVLAVALVFFGLVLGHVPGLNGPWYWKWGYRQLPFGMVYPGMLLAVIPALGVQFLKRNKSMLRAIALLGLMVSCFGLKLAATLPRTAAAGVDLVVAVVEQPSMTSYYTDAASIKHLELREWISRYPQLMAGFHLHTQSKPPGPVLYWWALIRWLGEDHTTSRLGGLLLGALATLSIPATYLLLRRMLADEQAAFCGASFMTLSPGFVLFFPMLDPVYPLISAAMIGGWYVALKEDRTTGAICTGLALAATLVVTFNTLVLGAFMLGMVLIVPETRPMIDRLRLAARQAGVVLLTTTAAMLLLWVAIGYDPIATFRSAWHHQHELLADYAGQRPYPATILFDLTDFALGAGWIGAFLAIGYFLAPIRRHNRLVILALIQLVLVALTGLLPGETARVWCFMLPLLMIPVGLELSRWPQWAQIACLALLLLITAGIHQNMQFLY